MVARSGPLPSRGRWAYEVKWDGFRALVRSGDEYRVRLRRGCDMTGLVPAAGVTRRCLCGWSWPHSGTRGG